MAWGQQTQTAHCIDCNQQFVSKQVFGQFTKRCDTCKVKKGTAFPTEYYNFKKQQEKRFDPSYGLNKPCTSSTGHDVNPGGYCYHCGRGGDHS